MVMEEFVREGSTKLGEQEVCFLGRLRRVYS